MNVGLAVLLMGVAVKLVRTLSVVSNVVVEMVSHLTLMAEHVTIKTNVVTITEVVTRFVQTRLEVLRALVTLVTNYKQTARRV